MIRFTASGSNNETILSEYIKRVIVPWKESNKLNPILLLDEASCHYTSQVLQILKECMILPIFVPGGATSLVQPLDVALNKPIKSSIRKSYCAWLENQSKKNQPSLVPLSIEEILDWCQVRLNSLSKNIIKDSFCHTEVSIDRTYRGKQNTEMLHLKLSKLFDEYLARVGENRNLLDDNTNPYEDQIESKFSNIVLEQQF